ncbi:MAG: prepilin-type N-terminal cleavage/methylation domain-containing protein [Verrucomicrobiales bacterium]|jgi:prepilin-type N-terminal cleavage/methylation domain-containing protein|nr:prepilin-type N-terminal cleavage/methylation domain-containing protein [Verrucomicrobiales bacterium]
MHIAIKHSKLAFTLIELLVVVTIIGILAGLSVPAFKMAMDAAKKAQAGSMISNLKVALNAYQADYGTWPAFLAASGNSDSTEISSYDSNGVKLYNTLIGNLNNSDATDANPRGTVYMEFTKKDLTSGNGNVFNGTSTLNAAGFMDPWGQPYWIKVDGNYDNQIDNLPNKSGSSDTINTSIAIWSLGVQTAPIKDSSSGGDRKKYITSW